MRILILSTVHRWNDPRIFYKEACTLAQEHEVILGATGERGERMVNGVRVRLLGTWRSRADRLKLWWRAYREIYRWKPDAIHFHDPELALILLPLAFFGNIQIICDIHEHPSGAIGGRKWIPKPFRKLVAALFSILLRLTPYIYDAVILAEERYAPLFPARKNVHVILNHALIPQPDAVWVDRYEKFDPAKELRLICVGSLVEDRGALKMVEMLDRVIEKYPKASLDLVGKARPRALEEELKRAERESGGRLRLHGYLDFHQVAKLLQETHIGLVPLQPHPNYAVSMATKFYDYMIYGLPFVASHFPLWRQFLEENPAGIPEDATDVEAFARAISDLVESPERLRELSRTGYRLVREKFNWESEAKKLLEIYRSL